MEKSQKNPNNKLYNKILNNNVPHTTDYMTIKSTNNKIYPTNYSKKKRTRVFTQETNKENELDILLFLKVWFYCQGDR